MSGSCIIRRTANQPEDGTPPNWETSYIGNCMNPAITRTIEKLCDSNGNNCKTTTYGSISSNQPSVNNYDDLLSSFDLPDISNLDSSNNSTTTTTITKNGEVIVDETNNEEEESTGVPNNITSSTSTNISKTINDTSKTTKSLAQFILNIIGWILVAVSFFILFFGYYYDNISLCIVSAVSSGISFILFIISILLPPQEERKCTIIKTANRTNDGTNLVWDEIKEGDCEDPTVTETVLRLCDSNGNNCVITSETN